MYKISETEEIIDSVISLYSYYYTTSFLCSPWKQNILRALLLAVFNSSSFIFHSNLSIRLSSLPLFWNCYFQGYWWPLHCKFYLPFFSPKILEPSIALEADYHFFFSSNAFFHLSSKWQIPSLGSSSLLPPSPTTFYQSLCSLFLICPTSSSLSILRAYFLLLFSAILFPHCFGILIWSREIKCHLCSDDC